MAKSHTNQKLVFRGKGAGASFDLGTLSGLFLASEELESEKYVVKSYPARSMTRKFRPTAKQILNAKDLARQMLGEFSEEKLLVANGIVYNSAMLNGSGAFVLVRTN